MVNRSIELMIKETKINCKKAIMKKIYALCLFTFLAFLVNGCDSPNEKLDPEIEGYTKGIINDVIKAPEIPVIEYTDRHRLHDALKIRWCPGSFQLCWHPC